MIPNIEIKMALINQRNKLIYYFKSLINRKIEQARLFEFKKRYSLFLEHIAYYVLHIAYSVLHIAYYALRITYCILRTTYYIYKTLKSFLMSSIMHEAYGIFIIFIVK